MLQLFLVAVVATNPGLFTSGSEQSRRFFSVCGGIPHRPRNVRP